jgi:hypothetical protein
MALKDEFFTEIYAIDKANNAYMIEAALDQYTDIFSEWDPAPFKRRELDPDLRLYMEGSSDEIPFRYPIELCFTLPAGKRDEAMEHEVRQGLKNSISFQLYLLKKEVKLTNARTLRYIIAGFGTLWVARVLSEVSETNTVFAVFTDGLFIGGWVFLWEAVSLFFFSNRDLYQQYRTYQRFRQSPVIFKDAGQDVDG